MVLAVVAYIPAAAAVVVEVDGSSSAGLVHQTITHWKT